MRRWMKAAGAALAVAAGVAAAGARAPVDGARDAARFDVYWGGLPVGELRYALAVEDGRYSAQASAETTGLVGALFAARLEAEGAGSAGEGVEPERFSADARLGDDRQVVEVRFGPGGRPQAVEADPPWKPRSWQIEPTAQTGAVDPMGAAAALLAPAEPEALCARALDIFDGRRLSRVTLEAPAPHRGELRCEGEWERVAGYKPEDLARGPVPLRVDYIVGEDGLARLRRVEVETGWGRGVALRDDGK